MIYSSVIIAIFLKNSPTIPTLPYCCLHPVDHLVLMLTGIMDNEFGLFYCLDLYGTNYKSSIMMPTNNYSKTMLLIKLLYIISHTFKYVTIILIHSISILLSQHTCICTISCYLPIFCIELYMYQSPLILRSISTNRKYVYVQVYADFTIIIYHTKYIVNYKGMITYMYMVAHTCRLHVYNLYYDLLDIINVNIYKHIMHVYYMYIIINHSKLYRIPRIVNIKYSKISLCDLIKFYQIFFFVPCSQKWTAIYGTE